MDADVFWHYLFKSFSSIILCVCKYHLVFVIINCAVIEVKYAQTQMKKSAYTNRRKWCALLSPLWNNNRRVIYFCWNAGYIRSGSLFLSEANVLHSFLDVVVLLWCCNCKQLLHSVAMCFCLCVVHGADLKSVVKLSTF